MKPMDQRQVRAQRWMAKARGFADSVEPEWWLRLNCGQLVEEVAAGEHPGGRHGASRSERPFFPFGRRRPRSAGVDWLRLLSRRRLPSEPAWWTLWV